MKTRQVKRTKRTNIQLPEPWSALLKELAFEKEQPILWYIQSLLAEKAREAGRSPPKLPWEGE